MWLSRAPAVDVKSVHYLQHLDHLASFPTRLGARRIDFACKKQMLLVLRRARPTRRERAVALSPGRRARFIWRRPSRLDGVRFLTSGLFLTLLG